MGEIIMGLAISQIIILNWFYQCHVKGESAAYKKSLEHFSEVMKISDPINVIKSLLDMGYISILKNTMQVKITPEGIKQYENLKKKA
jgi:hypothetical protein